jgi:hypothetical protein
MTDASDPAAPAARPPIAQVRAACAAARCVLLGYIVQPCSEAVTATLAEGPARG